MLYLCLFYIHYNLAIYPKQAVAYKICPTDMENDKNMVAEIDFLSKKHAAEDCLFRNKNHLWLAKG